VSLYLSFILGTVPDILDHSHKAQHYRRIIQHYRRIIQHKDMSAKLILPSECSVISITHKCTPFIMNDLMDQKSILVTKCLTTYITHTHTQTQGRSPVCRHMCTVSALANKTFSTQTTGIWIVFIMPEHVFSEPSANRRTYYTHHSSV
jgi:hypothetical protein